MVDFVGASNVLFGNCHSQNHFNVTTVNGSRLMHSIIVTVCQYVYLAIIGGLVLASIDLPSDSSTVLFFLHWSVMLLNSTLTDRLLLLQL